MSVNLRALIGKLNAASRSAVEGAAGLCLSRSHYDIEIEHFLVKALDSAGVQQKEKDELLAVLGPMRTDIVEK